MDVIGQMGAVAAVLGLLGGALWWLRRRGMAAVTIGRKRSRRKLELVERLPLSPQHALHLVRLGETMLLVAASPGGCRLIERRPAAAGANWGDAPR
ncbi:MAG: flagellar biosynthetic protein FliO [Bryobacteraceae bacterium]|jgi:flagellar biogenesis protein FliO